MLGSNFCYEKLKLIENQEAGRLCRKLRIRTSLSNGPLIGDIVF